MIQALQFEFFRNALWAGLLVSIACGVVGTLVVLRRVVFLSGGIAHAAYGGIGLGLYLGIDPLIGAVGFSLFSALAMGLVELRARQRADTVIGVLWALGMAVGIILIDLTPGYKADLMSYLFGSILAVPASYLWLMLVLDVVIVLFAGLFFKELVASSFDESYALTRGVPVEAMHLATVGLIALAVVMMMRVVGLIMVIALLTMPAAIAVDWVKDVRRAMVLAALLSVVFVTVGLLLSFTLDLTSGATIILVAGVCYLLSVGLLQLRQARGRGRQPAASR
ncbi:MAG: metal ABC transporter permease [Anaerolineae bacterium]|jgi:zinc transport system permease protein|nr:metal ABC transporter permease [Chloroflexota bacterium]